MSIIRKKSHYELITGHVATCYVLLIHKDSLHIHASVPYQCNSYAYNYIYTLARILRISTVHVTGLI